MKNKEIKKFYREFDLKKHARDCKIGLKILPKIIKLIKGKKRILDLACGYGRLTIPLARKGFEVCGVDISDKLIKQAKDYAKKEKIEIQFKQGSFLNIPYKKESFEAIIIIWTSFCHLLTKKDQINSLKEMKRVLKKKGIILIDVPYYTKKTKIETFEKKGFKIDLFMFNKKSLIEISKKAGFKRIKVIASKSKSKSKNRSLLIIEK